MLARRRDVGAALPLLSVEDLGGVDQAVVCLAAGDHDPVAHHGGRAGRARALQRGQLLPFAVAQHEGTRFDTRALGSDPFGIEPPITTTSSL